MSTTDLPTLNMESFNVAAQESYGEGLHAEVNADVSAGGDWDAGTNPLGSPPGLYIRDDLATVLYYIGRLDNVFWTFPYQRVRSSTVGTDVKDKVTFKYSGMNQGVFAIPTASV